VYNFGNDEPTIKAPSPGQQQKLAELEHEVAKAEAQLESLRPQIDLGVRQWAAELKRSRRTVDWGLADGLVYHAPLDREKIEFIEPRPQDGKKLAGAAQRETRDHKAETRRNREPGPRKVELVEGKFGSAAVLGERRYAEAGDVGGFNYNEPFSLSFWIYPESDDGAILNRMEDAKDPQGWGCSWPAASCASS
jgi:hypothetical protein